MRNAPHYKSMYSAAKHDSELMARKYFGTLGIMVFMGIALIFANIAIFKSNRALKDALTGIEQAQQATKEAQEKAYVVWQMDTSCFAQLKSASMVQLVIKE